MNKVDAVAQNQTVHMDYSRGKRMIHSAEVPTSPAPNATIPVVTPEPPQKKTKQSLFLHIQSPTATVVQVPVVLAETTVSTLYMIIYSHPIHTPPIVYTYYIKVGCTNSI